MATSEVTVGYWPARGRAGIIRNLLAYCGISFKNKLYTDGGEWFGKDKQSLGFDFPNIPYLIDGDKKLTETNAIIHYIPIRAGKKQLIGDSDDKFVQVEVALGAAYDTYSEFSRIKYGGGDFETGIDESLEKGKLKNKFELFNKRLGEREWLTGFLSIADFQLFEAVDMVYEVRSKAVEHYPNLISFRNRFLEIPEIKAFRQAENYVK